MKKDVLHRNIDKTQAIENFVETENVTELKSFLVMVDYYAKCVKNSSSIPYPFQKLLQKDAK